MTRRSRIIVRASSPPSMTILSACSLLLWLLLSRERGEMTAATSAATSASSSSLVVSAFSSNNNSRCQQQHRSQSRSIVSFSSKTSSSLTTWSPNSLPGCRQHGSFRTTRSMGIVKATTTPQVSTDETETPTATTTTNTTSSSDLSIYEMIAKKIVFGDDDDGNNNETTSQRTIRPMATTENLEQIKSYTNFISLLRVGIPSAFFAASAKIAYPTVAMMLAAAINDDGVFGVVAQDASQYIQNILTTSGLTFSLIVGQTYYFMYQQQEAIYLALFEEVTMAKSLLEQVSLVAQGRTGLYSKILSCVHEYVREDLTKFNDVEPAELLSRRPIDDPLEEILYLTSVGEPSLVYQTVRSLRQARSARLGALQRKLPQIHMVLLWTLMGIVLFTFPLLGAGSQTIGGPGILTVQSWYLSFIVFGMCLTMGIINELRRPGQTGAYNAGAVLDVMVAGLEEELDLRLRGIISGPPDLSLEPSIDSDGWYDPSSSNSDALQ
eukprot:CAMPEP_0113502666 /NCGR_PEP_ID=MMETSP0014_2-20120614/33696_1 /TAXON_ID=2857 /ORGANISM="Nitzschia sp." /LENGTH=493 /DNA_ID=CAMNT_0000397509 /DNA_START=27 /DNA_END=1508 /DNA_ORIENTATION=- /assembly_acc=CAM_ASM_000159